MAMVSNFWVDKFRQRKINELSMDIAKHFKMGVGTFRAEPKVKQYEMLDEYLKHIAKVTKKVKKGKTVA
jgi:hypothetical protein